MQPDTTDSTWVYEILAWFEANRKRVLITASALVALGLVIYVYLWSREQTEMAASKALLGLRAISGPEDKPAAAASEFLQVARSYRATRAGERALLLAAGNLFAESKYAEAQQQFEKFLSDYGDSSLAPIAKYGLAASLDAQDNTNGALAAYQEVIAKYPTDPVAGKAKLALAGFHEAKNQPEQALKIYDELIKPATMSGVAGEAASRREVLLRQHPNLAPTNQPARPKPAPSGIEIRPNPPANPAPPAAAPNK
jgi:predicted negative regulator of RcsB-dependent stress response